MENLWIFIQRFFNLRVQQDFKHMGKGDKKTKKGKISMGSYGVTRQRSKNKKSVNRPAEAKPKAEKKAEPKKAAATKKPAAKKAATKKKD